MPTMSLSRAFLLIVGLLTLLIAATVAAGGWHTAGAAPLAQDTRYLCTEFIGYSQTGQWVPYASITMNNGSTDRVQNRLHDGGAAIRWADPNYEGWTSTLNGPCAASASIPDRIVLDVTHYNYLDADCTETSTPLPGLQGSQCGTDPVGFMEEVMRRAIATIRQRRPSAVSIVLQPVFGGPGGATCPMSGGENGVVRASYNHPYIQQAIGRVVGGDVTMGYDSHVRTCADYIDWMGHLVSGAYSPLGNMVGAYYRDLRATPTVVTPTATATPLPPTATPAPPTATSTPLPPTPTATAEPQATAQVVPSATPTATTTIGATATPTPECFATVQVEWDGSWGLVDPIACP